MSTKLLDGLNHALNREVTTFLRYLLQGALIKGAQWESVRANYLAEVSDEVGHAQYLADKIEMLGGTPGLEPDLSPPPAFEAGRTSAPALRLGSFHQDTCTAARVLEGCTAVPSPGSRKRSSCHVTSCPDRCPVHGCRGAGRENR